MKIFNLRDFRAFLDELMWMFSSFLLIFRSFLSFLASLLVYDVIIVRKLKPKYKETWSFLYNNYAFL